MRKNIDAILQMAQKIRRTRMLKKAVQQGRSERSSEAYASVR